MVVITVYEKTREEIREARQEFNLIIKRCNEIGFDYVQQPVTCSKTCFGSKLPREVLPTKGVNLNSFMRCNILNSNPLIGPGTYSSCKAPTPAPNLVGFLSRVPRYNGHNGVRSKYLNDDFYYVNCADKKFKADKKPFGIGAQIERFRIISETPGVGTYNLQPKQKPKSFEHSFGGPIIPIPPVIIICTSQDLDKCSKCDESPKIDYWKNFNQELVLCRRCMQTEIEDITYHLKTKIKKIRKLNELESNYKLVRHCGIYHDHQNTTAKIRLLSRREIKNQLRREHYLSQFQFK